VHRSPFSPALLPVLVLCGACATETDSAATWDGSVRDSAGIEIVENYGEPLWRPGEEWRLVEDMRIGVHDGPPEYQFGRITGFVELSDGRIVVADGMAPEIRFFTAEGEHLYSVGKEGNGPKEFGQGWMILLRGPGDTLLVVDPRNTQVHRISPEGEWQASFKTRPDDGWRVANWDSDPTGLIVNFFDPLRRPDLAPADTMGVVVARHLDGTLGDTLGRVAISRSYEFEGDKPQYRYYAGGPDGDLRWDGGLITGRSDRYELTWWRTDGSRERIVRLHRDPVPFTGAEQAALMNRFDELLANRPPEVRHEIKNAIHFTDTYPYFRRFMSGPRGTLWLRRIRTIAEMTPEEVAELNRSLTPRPAGGFDVFDERGRYLGVVEVPRELPFGLLIGDRLFGIMKDELDVEYVQIWRIEGMDAEEAGAG
jgi:hypothetical protein